MTDWSRSTYLDLTSWNATRYDAGTTVEEAYGFDAEEVSPADEDDAIIVGFVLPRANDPSALLSGSWGERQKTLAELDAEDTLWATYGADPALYAETVAAIEAAGGEVDETPLSSPATRTIWTSLDPAAFEALLGQKLYFAAADDEDDEDDESGGSVPQDTGEDENGAGDEDDDDDDAPAFWNGALDPGDLGVEGLIVTGIMGPAEDDLSGGRSVELREGAQGIGNGVTGGADGHIFAVDLANFYRFPLSGPHAATATVALVATGIGDALPGGADFEDAFNAYLRGINSVGETSIYAVTADGDPSEYDENSAGERSLDVGVVGVVNPRSTIGFYDAPSVFGSLQLAVFDEAQDPSILSNSFADVMRPAPDSPFAAAWEQLYIDAALSGLAVFSASGDGGSGNMTGNGIPNIDMTVSSPFTTVVGGTSISAVPQAESDPTLGAILEAVRAEDRDILWALIAGGMNVAPKDMTGISVILETVWNEYRLDGQEITKLVDAAASSGGVDQRLGIPDYQADFGVSPAVDGSPAEIGRGVPDVSALAGGNFFYDAPNADLSETTGMAGTSASAPLWAALFQQIETIFAAQDLPSLGYATDLLYQAAAITPAAFRDVRFGDNRSTFAYDENGRYVATRGEGKDKETARVDATGLGYDAGEGFDLATGLGTPNGTVLTETLLAIAHKQLYFDTPAVLDETGDGGWAAGADQVVSIQVSSAGAACGGVRADGETFRFRTDGSDPFAWTSRLAGQSLDENMSADLLGMFDGTAQGGVFQIALDAGDALTVGIEGAGASAVQGALTSDHGFVDFASDGASLRVARNVAVAETEQGRDGMTFTVNLRQMSGEDVKLQIYEVDDLSGTIDGVAPGEKGYGALACANASWPVGRRRAGAYETAGGAKRVAGPGEGAFALHEFTGADAGDLIAMRVFTEDGVLYGFAAGNGGANGKDDARLWNYGANVWGFETGGGKESGDGGGDFNDLIVGFDFIDYADDLLPA